MSRCLGTLTQILLICTIFKVSFIFHHIVVLFYKVSFMFHPTDVLFYKVSFMFHPIDVKAKQPESGDLCGNITEFRMVEGSPEPTG